MNQDEGTGNTENPTLGVRMDNKAWGRLGSHREGQGTKGPGRYLAEGELPCELGPQHDHAAHPEQQEVTTRFQKWQGVETSQVWGLGEKDKQWEA